MDPIAQRVPVPLRDAALGFARGYLAFLYSITFCRPCPTDLDEERSDLVICYTPTGNRQVGMSSFFGLVEYRLNCYLDALQFEDFYQ